MSRPCDVALASAITIVESAKPGGPLSPEVTSFFDQTTFTVTHVVKDPGSDSCAIIDSVLDFDLFRGRVSGQSAQAVIDFVRQRGLKVQWLLETHVHADHLSAAPLLQARVGGTVAIGARVAEVQATMGGVFNDDGAQRFDRSFHDGDRFRIGGLQACALHVPGHTPACVAYVIGDAVFPGDTLFMPDYGTARCDFPGGDSAQLYRSIHRLLSLPARTRVFLCHDYKAPGRDHYAWETTIGAQRADNVHVRPGVSEAEFVAMRDARDAILTIPRLMLPSLQVNLQAGHLPAPESNGIRYLKIPIDQF